MRATFTVVFVLFFCPFLFAQQVTLSESWDDSNWNDNPEWSEFDNDDDCFALIDTIGHDNNPCAEVRSGNIGTDYTALYTPMNCEEEFTIDLWIHQRTETFSIFRVGVCQDDYSHDNRGVGVTINYHNMDGNWYLCYWDHDGEAQSHNEIRVEYDADRWVNLVISRDEHGSWTVIWDKDGDNEHTAEFEDSIEELDDPHIWWGGVGYYDNQGGSYVDDIIVTSINPHPPEPQIVLSENWDDGNWTENPTWQEFDNEDGCFFIAEDMGHDENPCGEVRSGNIGTDYTALYTPMNCEEEFTIDLWIHQRTETFSIFRVGVCQDDYSRDNRGVGVTINYHDMDGNWYLCYRDHDGEAQSHNEIRIEYDAYRWINLVISRDEDGSWIVIWDKDGDNEHTTEFEDSIEELDDPHLWWGGVGYYDNQGGSYVDDIVVWNDPYLGVKTDLRVEIPSLLSIESVYPNPFNAKTVINYNIAISSVISLNVYDISGRKVLTIFNGESLPGSHFATFNANDLPSGSYLIRLETGYGQVTFTKCVLVR